MTALADAFAHARRLTRKEKRVKQNAKGKVLKPEPPAVSEIQKLIEAGKALDEAKRLKRSLGQENKEMALLPRLPRPGFKVPSVLTTSRLNLPSQGLQRKVTQAFAKSISRKLIDVENLENLPLPHESNFMPEESPRPRPTQQMRDESKARLAAIDARMEATTAAADAARALRAAGLA